MLQRYYHIYSKCSSFSRFGSACTCGLLINDGCANSAIVVVSKGLTCFLDKTAKAVFVGKDAYILVHHWH